MEIADFILLWALETIELKRSVLAAYCSTELGTLGIFESFILQKMILLPFLQVNNLYLHQSYLKSSLLFKLTW